MAVNLETFQQYLSDHDLDVYHSGLTQIKREDADIPTRVSPHEYVDLKGELIELSYLHEMELIRMMNAAEQIAQSNAEGHPNAVFHGLHYSDESHFSWVITNVHSTYVRAVKSHNINGK